MIALARSTRALFRASLLVLLVVGVIVRPVLNQISELHAVEHAALAAAAGDGHGNGEHGHDDDHAHDDGSHPALDDSQGQEAGHTDGAHGLMHQADTGPSASLAGLIPQFGHSMPAPRLLAPASGPLPPQIPSTPFRPPIT